MLLRKSIYLGVILHRKLSWKPHISIVVAQVNSTRYFLHWNLSTCSRDVKLKTYKTYVKPIVEYASPAWDPNSKDLQCKVERVQHKAAHWITNDWRSCSSPTKMLEEVGLKKLQERRSIAKLKMLHSFIASTSYKLKTPSLLYNFKHKTPVYVLHQYSGFSLLVVVGGFFYIWKKNPLPQYTIFFLTSYSFLDTQVMQILILIDDQYSQKAVFCFEKG